MGNGSDIGGMCKQRHIINGLKLKVIQVVKRIFGILCRSSADAGLPVNSNVAVEDRPNQKVAHSFLQKVEYINPHNKVGADLCPTCVSFTGQAINTLLNLILQGGVVGTCGALCSALAQKTGSQALGEVCDLICDIAGIEEFIKLIEKADLDPIYFCEEMNLCPVKDDGQFSIDFTYVSVNGTGTGEIVLEVETVDHIPVEGSFLHELADAGSYPQSVKLKAKPDLTVTPHKDHVRNGCLEIIPLKLLSAMVNVAANIHTASFTMKQQQLLKSQRAIQQIKATNFCDIFMFLSRWKLSHSVAVIIFVISWSSI
ncbi:unnamed protein product [Mytilus edulis]|uniref:Saposin B-type domain-containing protein n=1 Tax=Mytilus edulis TaxID=6550 RepID=A0A8S3Q529_MYTED|nr:unnamed protein product [Mytilus edulis]